VKPDDVTHMTDQELELFNYAVGILAGLGDKYGARDVTIYHDPIRIQISRVQPAPPPPNGEDPGEG